MIQPLLVSTESLIASEENDSVSKRWNLSSIRPQQSITPLQVDCSGEFKPISALQTASANSKQRFPESEIRLGIWKPRAKKSVSKTNFQAEFPSCLGESFLNVLSRNSLSLSRLAGSKAQSVALRWGAKLLSVWFSGAETFLPDTSEVHRDVL